MHFLSLSIKLQIHTDQMGVSEEKGQSGYKGERVKQGTFKIGDREEDLPRRNGLGYLEECTLVCSNQSKVRRNLRPTLGCLPERGKVECPECISQGKQTVQMMYRSRDCSANVQAPEDRDEGFR